MVDKLFTEQKNIPVCCAASVCPLAVCQSFRVLYSIGVVKAVVVTRAHKKIPVL